MSSSLRRDPTRTTTIQTAFHREINARIARLIKSVTHLIETENAFGLGQKSIVINNRYQFLSDPDKIAQFDLWLAEQFESTLLERRPLTGAWQNKYIDSAYRKGVVRAYIDNKGLDAVSSPTAGLSQAQWLETVFNTPVHRDTLLKIYTRAFEGMKGITSDISRQLSGILATSIANGIGPAQTAKEIAKQIKTINKRRAIVIARTETIRAHAEGQLDSFEVMGLQQFQIMAEWSTAGDSRVCPLCAPKEGQVFTLKEARGMIPFHPQCRCAWLQFLSSIEAKKGGKRQSRKQLEADRKNKEDEFRRKQQEEERKKKEAEERKRREDEKAKRRAEREAARLRRAAEQKLKEQQKAVSVAPTSTKAAKREAFRKLYEIELQEVIDNAPTPEVAEAIKEYHERAIAFQANWTKAADKTAVKFAKKNRPELPHTWEELDDFIREHDLFDEWDFTGIDFYVTQNYVASVYELATEFPSIRQSLRLSGNAAADRALNAKQLLTRTKKEIAARNGVSVSQLTPAQIKEAEDWADKIVVKRYGEPGTIRKKDSAAYAMTERKIGQQDFTHLPRVRGRLSKESGNTNGVFFESEFSTKERAAEVHSLMHYRSNPETANWVIEYQNDNGHTFFRGLIEHELGHIIDAHIGLGGGKSFVDNPKMRKAYGKLLRKYISADPVSLPQLHKRQVTNALSTYASTSPAEIIAEAWAEYRTSPDPRPLARAIGKFLTNTMKQIEKELSE